VARRVSDDPWTPVVAAAVVALVPKFVFLSGVVNNDNLSMTLGAAATLVAVVLVTTDLHPRRQLVAAAGLGALAGLSAITKFSTLPLVAAWLVALALAPLRARLAAFGTFLAGFVVTAGWWFWWNVDQYGDVLAHDATQEHLERFDFLPLTGPMTAHRAFVEVPKAIWYQFFYSSGSNQFRWSNWVYVPFWVVLLVGVVGLVFALPSTGRRPLAVLGTVAVLSLATVWIAVIDTTSIQARHAFAGLPAIAVLAALGYERLRLPVVARFALPAMGLVGVVVALRQHVFDVFWT
jgi:MFS family permease